MAGLNENDMLEGMAKFYSTLTLKQKKKFASLIKRRQGPKGIKTVRKVNKISLGSQELITGDEEENTFADSDGRIVHTHTKNTNSYTCGHPITENNFGHKAECGHTACKDCVKELHLVCQRTGCAQKLCPLDDCYRYVVENLNLCRKHARELNWNLFLGIFNLHDPDLVCKRK